MDKASTSAGRAALVSGLAAIATLETGIGTVAFGGIATILEGASYGLAGISAGINYFNGNSRGAFATVLGSAAGFLLPKALVTSLPGLRGSSKAAGELVAGAEGDVAAQLTQKAACH